jgi:hypothetical protein
MSANSLKYFIYPATIKRNCDAPGFQLKLMHQFEINLPLVGVATMGTVQIPFNVPPVFRLENSCFSHCSSNAFTMTFATPATADAISAVNWSLSAIT